MDAEEKDPIGGHELALYAINTSALYFGPAKAAIEQCAMRKNLGALDDFWGVQAFGAWSDAAAQAYCREFGGGRWPEIFNRDTRKLAALEAFENYADEIRERAEELEEEAKRLRANNEAAAFAATAPARLAALRPVLDEILACEIGPNLVVFHRWRAQIRQALKGPINAG